MISSDFSPTQADVLKVLAHVDPLHETGHYTSRYYFRFTDYGSQQSGPTGWYSISSSVSSIIYCVNLAEYDHIEMGRKTTGLAASLDLFRSITKSDLRLTPVIMLCTHLNEFRQNLATSPLEKQFPDYSGGADVGLAVKYIVRKFKRIPRCPEIYAYTFDLTTTEDVWKIYHAHHELTKMPLWEQFVSGLAY